MAPQPSPTKKRGRPRKDDADRTVPAKKTRAVGKPPADRLWEIPDSDEERQKKGTRKTVENVENVYEFHDSDEAPTPPPKLKGILTPSKRTNARTKSVAFDDAKAHGEVFFEDLPSKPVKPVKPSPPTRKQPEKEKEKEGDEDEEEDDEVCKVCSKPDSRSGNQIIFCDSCDLAVHQKCYGVARIPKGDWFCKDCAKDHPPATSEKPSAKATSKGAVGPAPAAEVAPEIPNFEQHLRSLQRVLLDRCTGRRRIKLRDQDEAYDKTFQLVEQTVLAGEGNSMLVIGARGSGKTTVSPPGSMCQSIRLTVLSSWWTR